MVGEKEYVSSLISRIACVKKEDLASPSRAWPLTACRDILFMYFKKKGMTTPQIGRLFNRDHATVLSGIKRVKGWLDSDDKFVCGLYNRFNDELEKAGLNDTSGT